MTVPRLGADEIRELFDRARTATDEERERLVAETRAIDPDAAEELGGLLAAARRRGTVLDAPALRVLSLGPSDAVPERLGPYRILGELGRGGMGRVFLAEQSAAAFERRVALKVLDAPLLAGADAERRFRAEGRILATLEHPGIARLYDAGRSAEGHWYLALEYVEGETLLDSVERRELGLEARVDLFLSVLEAVQFAHGRLVVHRDLKPGNVLVGSDGRPRLLDFGIAKLLDAAPEGDEATRTELRALTPGYASPEQVRGEAVTTASDVFSLGVVLYELVCGARPFRAASGSVRELEQAVLESDPETPTQAARRAGRRWSPGPDLDAIVLRALRKEPAARYATAEAFAADLRRWRAGQPVEARRGGRRYRFGKFVRRHRLQVAALAAVFAALAVGLAVAIDQRSRAVAARERAERRFADVQELAHSMLFEVHDAIAGLPNTSPVRDLIATRALEYLGRLERDAGDDPALLGDLAAAYERIAAVARRGHGTAGASGAPDRSRAAFERAIALRRRAADRPGASAEQHERLIEALAASGLDRSRAGDEAAYRVTMDEALARARAVAAAAPAATLPRYLVARVLTLRVDGEANLDYASPRVEAALDEAWAAWRPLLPDPPPDVRSQPEFGATMLGLSQDLQDRDRRLDSEVPARLAVAALAGPAPALLDRDREFRLAAAHGALGEARRAAGDSAEAWTELDRAAAIHRAWLGDRDARLRNQASLLHCLAQLPALAVEAGHAERAEEYLREGERLIAGSGWSAGYQEVGRAALDSARGDMEEALAKGTSGAESARHAAAARRAWRAALDRIERGGAGGAAHVQPELVDHLRDRLGADVAAPR